jgi:hypothetical protein
MVKSWLVRALVPGHLHVQGSRLLAMARQLARSLLARLYDPCVDDRRRSAGCHPRTPPTSRLGRTASIIGFFLPPYIFLSCLCTHDRRCGTFSLPLNDVYSHRVLVQQRVLLLLQSRVRINKLCTRRNGEFSLGVNVCTRFLRN